MSPHKAPYDPTELCTKAFTLSMRTFKLSVLAVILAICAVAPHVMELLKGGAVSGIAVAHTLTGEGK